MSDGGPKAAKKPRGRPEKTKVPPPSEPAPPLFDDLLDNYAGVAPLTDWEAKPTVVTGKPIVADRPVANQNVAARKPSFRPSTEAQRASSLDEQMFVLLGGQAFRQQEPSRIKATRLGSVTKRGSLTRIVWVTTLLAVAAFSALVVSFGLERRAEEEAKELATQLKTASDTGQLVDAEELLRAIEDSDIESADQAKLLATTEAVLFRERDADPKRLTHIKTLRKTISGDAAFIIDATLLSHAERVPLLDDLERIADNSTDALPVYLLAVTLARAGRQKKASEQFEIALDREPSNLEHLAAFARHCIETGDLNEAENTLEIMREVNPGATRTRLVALRLNRAQKTNRHPVPDVDETDTGAVGQSQLNLTRAIQAYADNKTVADKHLAQTLTLIHDHPAFVLDIVDELLVVGWFDAAESALKRLKTGQELMPVRAAKAQIELSRGNTKEAIIAMHRLFEEGYREPRFGSTYLKALTQSGAPKAQYRQVQETLRKVWPEAEWAAKVVPKRTKKRRKKGRRKRRKRR